ncbi:MAG: SMC-Scp complex subunit ScpB [Myxococcaceae bacterium]|nr:SMC-Scp complex subunit ScpB [Myxococcaceae bacterium]MBH2006625.1 SMC-Scp complex subunit ScpB [Myxococcaceae bacterium]
MFNLEHALEAILFASPEPLSLAQIVTIFENQGYEFAKEQIQETFESLRHRETGISLQEVGGGYVFRTVPAYGDLVRALLQEKPQRLSASQLEVLSIVAYRQPVTRQEIEDIRGVDCSGSLKRLLTLKLVKIMGKSQGLGRPLLYGTSKEFLEFFAFNSLHELPSLKEYQDLNQEKVGDEEKEQLEPETLADLFLEKEFFSKESEQQNQKALKELDRALGVLVETSKSIQSS